MGGLSLGEGGGISFSSFCPFQLFCAMAMELSEGFKEYDQERKAYNRLVVRACGTADG